MKISLRKVIASVLLAGAALSSAGAYADVANVDSGNGGLVLFVRNETTLEVYARDLQLTMNDVVPETVATGPYSGPTQVPFVLAGNGVGPDALLTSFLGSPSSAGFTWGLLAGDSVGSNAAGTRRYLLTTPFDLTDPQQGRPTNTNLTGLGNSELGFFIQVNGALPDSPGSSVRGTDVNGGIWGAPGTEGAAANQFFGLQPGVSGGPTGVANPLNLFVVTSAGGGGSILSRVFQAADLVLLADGTLQSVAAVVTPPTGEVPLPAAVWLLGSGLVGLAGIGRRRREASQA